MQITQIDQLKQLPAVNCRAYAIGQRYTTDDAATSYEHRYGVKPELAWQWHGTLYIQEPEGKKENQ